MRSGGRFAIIAFARPPRGPGRESTYDKVRYDARKRVYPDYNLTLEDLRAELGAGNTVILEIQAWKDKATAKIPWGKDWEDGHFVVLAGMDRDYSYFMDPATYQAYAYIPLPELLSRWHDDDDYSPVCKDCHGHGPSEVRKNHYKLGIIIRGETPLKGPAVFSKPPSRMR